MNEKDKILVIDDELSPRESIRMVLCDRYDVSTASGGMEGIEFIDRNPVDLVVLDIMMPGMDGISTLREIKMKYPDTEVVLLTAYASIKTAKYAVRFGALDYLTKPFDKDDVLAVVKRGLERKRIKDNMKKEQEDLLSRTATLQDEVDDAKKNITKNFEGTMKALIRAIDAKDQYTSSHSEKVADLSYRIAMILGMTEDEGVMIKLAANMHDIGKIGIDESILKKKGLLSSDEYQEMKKHPQIGASIIREVPLLEYAVPVILYHHERYDGTGYPEGISGDLIPLPSRIILIADAIDAMMHARPYRGSLARGKIIQELEENTSTQFDPDIVDILLKKEKLPF